MIREVLVIMPNEQYMDIADDLYSEMRLLIEGAITLFEDEASTLGHLAMKADDMEASFAFNDIGCALYTLRDHIKRLRDEHHRQSINELGMPAHSENKSPDDPM